MCSLDSQHLAERSLTRRRTTVDPAKAARHGSRLLPYGSSTHRWWPGGRQGGSIELLSSAVSGQMSGASSRCGEVYRRLRRIRLLSATNSNGNPDAGTTSAQYRIPLLLLLPSRRRKHNSHLVSTLPLCIQPQGTRNCRQDSERPETRSSIRSWASRPLAVDRVGTGPHCQI